MGNKVVGRVSGVGRIVLVCRDTVPVNKGGNSGAEGRDAGVMIEDLV